MYNQSVNSHCKLNLLNIYYLALDLLLKIPVTLCLENSMQLQVFHYLYLCFVAALLLFFLTVLFSFKKIYFLFIENSMLHLLVCAAAKTLFAKQNGSENFSRVKRLN